MKNFLGGSETPKKTSFKIVSAATRLAALFLVPAYTGAILSFIMTPKIELPFMNVKEFVEDGAYKLGYIESLNGAILFKVNEKLLACLLILFFIKINLFPGILEIKRSMV